MVLTKTNSSSLIVFPAVAARVTTTATKMQFRKEEELIGHGADRMVDGPCCIAPGNGHSLAFIYQITGVIGAWHLVIVIWQEGKQAVWVAITVPKLDKAMIGGETLVAFPCCG